jgi:parallel beta-helix repeat protein
MNPKVIFIVILSAIWCCFPASAAQIRVPADQPTIQQGINSATNGDTVLVAAGTYYEGINFSGKNIVVVSEAGPETTIIDPLRTSRVVTITGSLGRSARLQGFTLRNGNGGLYLSGASVTIAGNIITSNAICGSGSGVDIEFCSPLIISNLIFGNFQVTGCFGGQGAGILVNGAAAAEIVHNTIVSNSIPGNGGGIQLFASGTPIIRENLIGWNSGSSGGAIAIANYGDATIINNVIVSNTASGSGGGIYTLVPLGRRGPYVINNTLACNRAGTGSGIYSDGFDTTALYANNIVVAYGNQTAFYVGNFDSLQPIMRYNDFFSPSGPAFGGLGSSPVGTNGNISADPLFMNPPFNDYHLRSNSPAIDAGFNSDAPTNDFDYASRPYDGNGDGTNQVDMGAYEWSPTRAKLISMSLQNQQPALAWISSGGVRYRVQYSDGGSQGYFNGVFTDIVRAAADETDPDPDGVPSIMSFTDTNTVSTASRSRFYRLRTISQP